MWRRWELQKIEDSSRAESGLHYNLHRYYNPHTVRFITPDPL
ncbi:RHS repeat-associated core domain-containing protein [Rhodococcus sp. ARC_M6]